MIEPLIGHFAAARDLEKAGQYDAAFSALMTGNAQKFATLQWNEDVEQEAMQAVLDTFTARFINTFTQQGNQHLTPIFIVGMPRSGSTLVEQILASHPDVAALGEVPYLGEAIGQVMPNKDSAYYPLALPQLPVRALSRIRHLYLNQLPVDRDFVTDKMLSNFYHVGLIKMLFPHAKVIHCVRRPLDTCLSAFALLFNQDNLAFTYDLEAMGNYYLRYRRIMEHWCDVLPDFVFNIGYEDMVLDFDVQVNRLLDFVGLPFHPDCLHFYENKREVRTCSREQVKRPIYSQSIDRATPFFEHLAPLRAIIRDYI